MTSSLLSSHLEQISLCAASIAELPFPGPKIFTNALLAPHDITALIRDTEAHERALFSVAPPPVPTKSQIQEFTASLSGSVTSNPSARRTTTYPGHSSRQPRRDTAVAAVLGGDLYRKVRDGNTTDGRGRYGRAAEREKGEIDVEALLEGAEKLCGVYPIPDAVDKIAQLRRRHQQLTANISHYEERVSQQSERLDRMYQARDFDGEEDFEVEENAPMTPRGPFMTKEDLQREEQEIRDLERKKRGLEERVTGMEKDLGGLMR